MSNEKKVFTTVANGYNPDEVDLYVAELERQMSSQSQIVETLDIPVELLARLQDLEEEVERYREIEISLKNALEATHIATKRIQAVVEDEARKILFEANQNADFIVNEALAQSISALDYIKKMRTDARVFQKRFQILVDEQNKMSKELIWNEVLAPIDKYNVVELHSIEDILQNNEEKSK